MIQPLHADQLYHPCDPTRLNLDPEQAPASGNLTAAPGQSRALEAIDFGIGMHHQGYNLYVMGPSGLGKHALVQQVLKTAAAKAKTPPDLCYVNNHQNPQNPRLLQLPAGQGNLFAKSMRQAVEALYAKLTEALEADDYQQAIRDIKKRYQAKEDEATGELDEQAQSLDIALIRTSNGFNLAPTKDGRAISPEEFDLLSEDEQAAISQRLESLKAELKESLSRFPHWQKALNQEVRELRQGVFDRCLAEAFMPLESEHAGHSELLAWLKTTKADMRDNPGLFQDSEDEEQQHPPALDRPELKRYQVNLLVDNAATQGAPVIHEDNPGYQNLVGRVEHVSSQGTLLTDFSLIKAGALHRANGGYLILDADKILSTPFVWPALKRVLKAQSVRIESLERVLSLATTISLEPEPAPVALKVVLIGERMLYFLLKEYDTEFIEFFKVAADFADELERTRDNETDFARAMLGIQQEDRLRPLDGPAICRVIEQAARLAEDGERLSLRLERIRELLHEADYWASKSGHQGISVEDVETALAAQARRMGQWRERLQGHIRRGLLMIDTRGSQLGRINALSVLELGDYSFGTASRISATARLGSGEIIDIAREIDQGGQIHSKGVMILSAYLGRRYAKHQPLSLNASLVFEQTYGSVDGDSASAAELCALLSAIGDLPIRQSLAITGSVNQHGEVQVIGGVNEKIEGFFEICRDRCLDGSQGVIIPQGNRKDLMLHRQVREAVAQGQFHIYAVSHVEEAMELLTGLTPGIQDSQGMFSPGSFNHQIQLRLLEWIALQRHYASPGN